MNIPRDVCRRASSALLALVAAAAAGGCVAAGLATAPLVSAVQLVSDRSVVRTVGADIQEAWAAAETALMRMAFRVEGREREDAEWRLRGVADRTTVQARLERVTPRVTRVTLRVEIGSILADRPTADAIHAQIATVLADATRTTVGAPASAIPEKALMSLESEVRRLRTEMEDRRSTVQPSAEGAGDGAPAMRVEPAAIVTVPLSAALPSVPGHVPPISVVQPVGAFTPTLPDVPVVGTPTTLDEASAAASPRVTPARPADALVPVRPVSAPGSGT